MERKYRVAELAKNRPPDNAGPPNETHPADEFVTEYAAKEFAILIKSMSQLRQIGLEIQENLTEIAAPEESSEPSLSLLDTLSQVGDVLYQVKSKLTSTKFARAEFVAKDALESLHRRAQTLRAVASLARSTAAASGVTSFDVFCANLQSISNDLSSGTMRMIGLMDCANMQTSMTLSALSAAEDAMSNAAIEQRFSETGMLPESRIFEARSSLVASSFEMAKDLNQSIGKLIQHAQFSDQFDQRLSHVFTMKPSQSLRSIAHIQTEALAIDTASTVQVRFILRIANYYCRSHFDKCMIF